MLASSGLKDNAKPGTIADRPMSAAGRRRIGAFVLDNLFIAAYLIFLAAIGTWASVASWGRIYGALWANPAAAQLSAFALLTLPVLLYFALMEASPWQGTFGKRALRLVVVTDGPGRRITLPRSVARSAMKFAPWQLAHSMIYLLTFSGPSASPSALVIGGFAAVYGLATAYVVTLFVGSRRTVYDRIAGTSVIRS